MSPLAHWRIVNNTGLDDEARLNACMLARPIQFDALIDALSIVEKDILESPAAPVHEDTVPAALEAAPMHVALMSSVAATPTAAATPSFPLLLPLAQAPQAIPLQPQPPALPHAIAQSRVRLRRWPPADILHSSRHGLRLATFISARWLKIDELKLLSGIQTQDCSEFLARLHEAGLLAVQADTASPPAEGMSALVTAIRTDAASASPAVKPPAAPSEPRPPAPRPSASRGLLQALRIKLGLFRGAAS